MKLLSILLCLLPALLWGQSDSILILPHNPRILGMGGAYVAIANDPQAGILNPAGIDRNSRIGYDMSFSASTVNTPDQISFAYLNPQSDSKTSFAMGSWFQGLTKPQSFQYYIPYVSTRQIISSTNTLGLVIRAPYRKTRKGSEKSKWGAVADLSFIQNSGQFQIGGIVERAIGGSMDIIPRRLRAGAAFSPSNKLVITYEWQGEEGVRRYRFRYESSHIGSEIILGKYVALRAGYVSADEDRISAGAAIGLLSGGWRLESAFEIPSDAKGMTRWSAGLGYRL